MPCDGSDLRDLSRIQEGICGAAERRSDIERDDEFSRRASVPGARYIHGGCEGKAIARVRNRSTGRGFKYLSGPATHFLYRIDMKGRRTITHLRVEADPINNEENTPYPNTYRTRVSLLTMG